MPNEMRKKKILFVITKSVWGGTQKYVYDLAVNLPKNELDVSVAYGGNGSLAEKLQKTEIRTFHIKHFQRDISFFSDFFAFFEILKILRKKKPDIIHANSSKAAGIAGIAALIYKILNLKAKNYLSTGQAGKLKIIFTVHGWAFNEARPKWQIFLIKLASRLTCVFYDKIICVSEFDRQAAIQNKIAPEKKLITIHNGITLDERLFLSKEEAVKKLQIMTLRVITRRATNYDPSGHHPQGDKLQINSGIQNQNNIIIGTIGEFTKNKGHLYLIETISRIIITGYPIACIIIGWGENKQKLEEKIKKLGLENQVFLIEGVSPAAPYLKAFDIFVLPSLKEGLPYTLLEVGLARLPVIATNVGGIPEIIENKKTGLLIKPADANTLANMIQKLMEDKNLRENLAEKLHQKIISEFSLEKMIEETLKIYL